ncbi:MAG: DUF4321 domain-containing protein [Candidatus Methylomirabilia bacterium]
MAGPQRRVAFIFLVLLIGLVFGSFVGDLIATLLPGGFSERLFTAGPTIGLTSPATLDLRVVSLTLGLAVKLNLVAVLGVVLAALALRKL